VKVGTADPNRKGEPMQKRIMPGTESGVAAAKRLRPVTNLDLQREVARRLERRSRPDDRAPNPHDGRRL
jgi:hypothetical protein